MSISSWKDTQNMVQSKSKNWSSIYAEKVADNDIKSKKKVLKAERDTAVIADQNNKVQGSVLNRIWARTVLQRRLLKNAREKVRTKPHSCTATLFNTHAPAMPADWTPAFGNESVII